MSDVDDLVAAMVKGDPGETVPLDVVTAMAKAAIWGHWIPSPHDRTDQHTCTCRAVVETEDTDGR